MRYTWLMTAAIGLLMSGAACSRPNKSEQLAALNSAYQSGIFTKEEYEAKKAALLASSAQPVSPSAPIAPAPITPPAATAQSPAAPAQPTPPAPTPPAALPRPTQAAPPAAVPSRPPAAPVEVASIPKNPPAATDVRGKNSDQDEQEPAPSAGCEDTEYKSGGKGMQERFFPMPVATVKKEAAAALKSLDFTVHKNAGKEIEASKNRHIGVILGSGGERVLLQFMEAQKGGQKGTRMTAETKKSIVGRLAQKSWTNAILAQTACMLKKNTSR